MSVGAGEWLPEKGERIFYEAASDPNPREAIVTHYAIYGAYNHDTNERYEYYNRIFIHFVDVNGGFKNARLLKEVRPYDYRESTAVL